MAESDLSVRGPGLADAPRPRWPDRGNLTTISFVAFLTGAVTIGHSAIAIANTFGHPVEVTLFTKAHLPADAAPGSARLVDGTFSTADVTVADVSDGARWLLAGGTFVMALAVVIVAACVMYFCYRLVRGRPFVPALTRALTISAFTLIIVPATSQALTGFGQWVVASELDPELSTSIFLRSMHVDVWPFIVGVVLGLVIAAFRIGERVERERRAATREAARLRRDTEGLV